jgi:hypothetical protein
MTDSARKGVLTATLSIDIINNNEAQVRIDAQVLPPPTDEFQVQIVLWGEDDGLRGDDDFLYFVATGLPDVHGDRIQSAKVTFTIDRKTLDEDQGRGAVRRLRHKRDEDEIYAKVRLLWRPRPGVAMEPYGGVIQTNTVKGYF